MVVPAAVRGEWERASRETGVAVRLLTHTLLARRLPTLGPEVSLLLVDEAHAFRNAATRRYRALAELAAGRRVALLTATPFNNSPADLVALLRLFAGRDRFRELGLADVEAALRHPGRGDARLALAAVSVCRTRRLVQARFPALRAAFPVRRLAPAAEYDLEATYGGGLAPLLAALAAVAEGTAELDRGAALFHLALLRRLESSRAALRRSLLRHHDFLAEAAAAAAAGRRLSRREFRSIFPRGDEDDTQLAFLPLLLSGVAGDAPRADASRSLPLQRAISLLEAADRGPDPKLERLVSLLAGPLSGKRTVVFTEYRDTALHLAHHLRRRFRVLVVTGDGSWAGPERLARRRALDAFAPRSRGARPDGLLAADILVATDVASEGMNLQDASAVVNYDLPWNPVRVMQRAGRVDRLGALEREVLLAHIVPAGGLRRLTGVLHTLRAKLAAVPGTLGAEPDPLAALWWLDEAKPLVAALERESWRAVEPFEAAERWRMIMGPRGVEPHGRPVIAAGIVDGGDSPRAGVLLALEWPSGDRVPLPFVLSPSGAVRLDGYALGELAVEALCATPLPCRPSDFACALASALPAARGRLLAMSASRRGDRDAGVARRSALRDLLSAAHRSAAARDGAASERIARALDALAGDLPAGLERRLHDALRAGCRGERLAREIAARIAPALPPAGQRLDGTPRLVLVGAIALAARCPSA